MKIYYKNIKIENLFDCILIPFYNFLKCYIIFVKIVEIRLKSFIFTRFTTNLYFNNPFFISVKKNVQVLGLKNHTILSLPILGLNYKEYMCTNWQYLLQVSWVLGAIIIWFWKALLQTIFTHPTNIGH